jgi:hypothetical protein
MGGGHTGASNAWGGHTLLRALAGHPDTQVCVKLCTPQVVAVKYSENRAKSAIFWKDMLSSIYEEEPYAAALAREAASDHCFNCFRVSVAIRLAFIIA